MTTLISEDLTLLLLDDETGKFTENSSLGIVLGGAVLVELALAEAVVVSPKKGFWQHSVVQPTGSSVADPVLQHALEVIGEKERSAQDLVNRLGNKLTDTLLPRLVERGILEQQEGKTLGLFPRKRWPAVDSSHEAEVRRKIGDALIRGVTPDERTAALISLLAAIDNAHKIVDREGLNAGDVKKRAKAISEGDWAAKAVKDAVAAAQAAIMAAVMVSTTVAATSN